MKVYVYSLIFGVVLWPNANTARAASANDSIVVTPPFLNRLMDEALTNNPALRAAAARIQAAQADRSGVRMWEDPMLMFGTAAGPRMMRREEGDLLYGVEQKLPLWGKPGTVRNVAEAELDRETAQADYETQMLRLDVTRTAFQIALADHTVKIGREDLAWLETMVRIAVERYRTGDGSQVEALRLQNERSRRATQLVTDEQQRDQRQTELNRWLGRSLTNLWPTMVLPQVAPEVAFTDRLRKLSLNNEARLRVLRREVQRAQAAVKLTEKQRLPDVSVGAEGRQYTGDGGFKEGMFIVKLNLPLFNRSKYRSDVTRDQARLQATEQSLADYELFVPTEANRIVTQADAARREALVYRDEIIPRSELALQSAHAAWLEQRGLFLDMMEARRMLLEAQHMHARAVAEQYQMLAELTLCCGAADLESLQMLGVRVETTPDPPRTKQP